MALPSSPTSKSARNPNVNEKATGNGKPNLFKRGLHWLKGDHENDRNKSNNTGAAADGTTKEASAQNKRWGRKPAGGDSREDGLAIAQKNVEEPAAETPKEDVDRLKVPEPIGRTDSEKRERMQEVKPSNQERRALSVDKRRSSRLSTSRGGDGTSFEFRGTETSLVPNDENPRATFDSLVPVGTAASLRSPRATVTSIHDPRTSNRSLLDGRPISKAGSERPLSQLQHQHHQRQPSQQTDQLQADERMLIPTSPTEPPVSPTTAAAQSPDGPGWYYGTEMDYIDEELEWRWILNLSMHFRDRTDREKFFVTYAETPRLRRRVTVSCDYRSAEEGSLEYDLMNLQYQADKSARIYESIRDSLLDIEFYDTVTNLKLQTENGRLHVHVTEDVNEIIHFPHVSMIAHLDCRHYKESELDFDSHLSGFVYKVRVSGEVYIKKEIPGPDTIDEFLYEVNALHALRDSSSVIRFGGLIVDERDRHVRGLLIAFAEKGSLIDIVYRDRGQLTWRRRERWARQILSGLSEIHEAGFVQGDFTMSNMVVDGNDDVKIIDINRRGCPIGWEPPEIAALIDTQQRIGMFIGVKSDLYQLGMVLWGLVYQVDEPETAAKPLDMDAAPTEIPDYFKEIVMTCLSPDPKNRISARELLQKFPPVRRDTPPPPINITEERNIESSKSSPSSSRSPGSLRTKNVPSFFPDSPNGGMFVESPVDLSASAARGGGGFEGLDSMLRSITVEPAPSAFVPRKREGTDDESLVLCSRDVDSIQAPDIPPDSPIMDTVSSPASEVVENWQNWALESQHISMPPEADTVVVEPVHGGVRAVPYFDDELSPTTSLAHPPPQPPRSPEPGDHHPEEHSGSSGRSSRTDTTPQPSHIKDPLQRGTSAKRGGDATGAPMPPPFERLDSTASAGVYETPSEEFPPSIDKSWT